MSSSSGRTSGRARRGRTEPRLSTPPLRPLTPETTLGYSVIDFAEQVLRINLYPWQKWLLIHALELNEDGTYRFRKVVVLVARQNGKSLLLKVLALWWLFVDAEAFPELIPVHEFTVLGTAQNLDMAEEAWEKTLALCDPEDDDPEEIRVALPALQSFTRKPIRVNGKKALRLHSGARYEVRAASRKSGRGKSIARVIIDELREQQNFEAWSSISKTANATFNSQLWGVSNAGDAKSVVLTQLRESAAKAVSDWERMQATGESIEAWASTHDPLVGLFEWSAPEGCEPGDEAGILQANPSIGYGHMTWQQVMSDLATDPEAVFRTEVLCQWVTAIAPTYLDPKAWGGLVDRKSQPVDRLVLAVDTSADRTMSYVAVAGLRADGLLHVEVIAERPGMLWVPEYVRQVATVDGISHVAVQARGAPASEFVPQLKEDPDLTVIEVGGPDLGAATGRFRDRVRDGSLRHLGQMLLDMAVSGGVARRLGELRVWDRIGSAPIDVAPLVAVTYAAFAVDTADLEPVRSAYSDHDLVVV